MSGIVAAHRLQQAGVPVRRSSRRTPTSAARGSRTPIPGCRVDVPNHFYSYSFAQTPDWPGFFSDQQVLLEYFRTCADELGLRPHIRFDTEVVGAELDEDDRRSGSSGARRQAAARRRLRFHAIVSAVGQLNRPSFPDIPGRERYAGDWFHSARVGRLRSTSTAGASAIIGTGASAAQFIPVGRRARQRARSSSSARRRGSSRRRTTTTSCRPGCGGCCTTSRSTPGGTGCGCSGAGHEGLLPMAAGRSRVGRRRPDGRRAAERPHPPAAHRLPRRSRSPTPSVLRQGAAELPADRQADRARQRRVRRGRCSATNVELVTDTASPRSPRRASGPSTASSTRSTSSSTAPASRRRSSSRRCG